MDHVHKASKLAMTKEAVGTKVVKTLDKARIAEIIALKNVDMMVVPTGVKMMARYNQKKINES